MKKLIYVVVVILCVSTQCSTPEPEVVPESILENRIKSFRSSLEFQDLKNADLSFDWSKAHLGEFAQFDVLILPLANGTSHSPSNGRDSKAYVQYAIQYDRHGGWSHFLKMTMKGDHERSDFTDFTGELIFEYYTGQIYSLINFENGKFENYQVIDGNADGSRNAAISGRTEMILKCKSICHILDCAGRNFEKKGWIGKLACAYSMPTCITLEAISCIESGCDNSFYNECGAL